MKKKLEVFYALESIGQFDVDHELYEPRKKCVDVSADEAYRLISLCQDGDEVGIQIPADSRRKSFDFAFFKVDGIDFCLEYHVVRYGQFRKKITKLELLDLLKNFHIPSKEELFSDEYQGFSV